MNTELLLRVKAHILEEPRRLNMSDWIQDAEAGLDVFCEFESIGFRMRKLDESEVPPCGTVACIAGWTCLISGKNADAFRAEKTANKLLGLHTDQSQELFFPHEWINRADYEEYKSCGNAEQRAQIVARVIDGFIAKYEEPAK